jgi:hypothetical protein
MGFLERGILLYLLFAIAVTIFNPSMVFGVDGQGSPLSWLKVGTNSTDPIYYDASGTNELQGDAAVNSNTTKNQIAPPTGVSVFVWIDGLKQVFGWVASIFLFIFSPIIFLATITGGASVMTVLIGIPLVILFLWGILYFIRSGA